MKKILLLLAVSFNLQAGLKEDIGNCVNKKGELLRLACFDQAAKSNNLINKITSEKIEGKGNWLVETDVNPIDDSETTTLQLNAKSGKGKYGDSIPLIIRCKSNKTELYINWHSYLGGDAYILSRIGKTKATTLKWSLSTDSKASFYPKSGITFIKSMFSKSKYVAQVTPYGDNPITAIFDITGIENAIKPLRKNCNW